MDGEDIWRKLSKQINLHSESTLRLGRKVPEGKMKAVKGRRMNSETMEVWRNFEPEWEILTVLPMWKFRERQIWEEGILRNFSWVIKYSSSFFVSPRDFIIGILLFKSLIAFHWVYHRTKMGLKVGIKKASFIWKITIFDAFCLFHNA